MSGMEGATNLLICIGAIVLCIVFLGKWLTD